MSTLTWMSYVCEVTTEVYGRKWGLTREKSRRDYGNLEREVKLKMDEVLKDMIESLVINQ